MDVEEQFVKYKNITLTIIEIVKVEDYEKLDDFFLQRQLILDNINKLNYSQEELNTFFLKCDIYKLDKTLEEEIKNRKEKLLAKIKETQKRRTVMNGYNNLQARAVFLSKQL